MSIYPDFMLEDGKARYQELLREAEVERRFRRSKAQPASLLAHVGDLLIATGQRLQGQLPSASASPVLRAK